VFERPVKDASQLGGRFLIPVTVDDLAANGLLEQSGAPVCWERSVETLMARKDEITGHAVATDEQIEAYILYIGGEIMALRSFVDDGGARLEQLLGRLGARTFRLPKVHPAELAHEFLERIGFHIAGVDRLFAAKARSQ
jgi:hypothetical protein